jgi:hypothetical protein
MNADDDRIERYLRALPKGQPDAGLAVRVIEGHLRRRRLRRNALALAASMTLGVLSWQWFQPVPEAPVATSTPSPIPAWVEIRALDRQLQAGYLAGAPEAELSRLWQRREAALSGMEQPRTSRGELQL